MDKEDIDVIVKDVDDLQRIVEAYILKVGDQHGVNAVISVLMNVGTSMLANMLAILKFNGVDPQEFTDKTMAELARKTITVSAELQTMEFINKFTLNKGNDGKVH